MGVLESFTSQNQHPLQNSLFIKFFASIRCDYQIVEYYLVDEFGSFLMLDASGIETWLIVRTAVDMEFFCELAEGESGIKDDLLRELHNREKIVFFPKGLELIPSLQKWVIIPATRLAETTIYYALLQGKECHPKAEQIVSYKNFLDLD